MSTRAPRPPALRSELTDRQREVLRLVARGHTNYEIAQQLGISLEGAKYHVREIMARLEVNSREEAAELWRRDSGYRARLARALTGLVALSPARLAVAGGAAVGVVAVGIAVILAISVLDGSDEAPGTEPSASPTRPTAAPTTATSAPATTAATATSTPVLPEPAVLQMIEEYVMARGHRVIGPCPQYSRGGDKVCYTVLNLPSGLLRVWLYRDLGEADYGFDAEREGESWRIVAEYDDPLGSP